jgi:glycosyltransferase involved in cell wall biosynthesis
MVLMTKRTIRILLVHNFPPRESNPSGIFVYEQASDLESFSDELEVSLYSIRRHKHSLLNYLDFRHLVRILRREAPDCVHVHYGLCLIPVFFASIFYKRIKYVATFHGSDLCSGSVVRFISNLFCYVLKTTPIVVSERMKPFLWGVNRKICRVIPCALHIPSDYSAGMDFRILTVLFPADPMRSVKNFSGYLELVRQLQRKGICVRTIFLSAVDKRLVSRYLMEADMVVLVSKWEGSPQIVKEAISQLVPVYSLDVGDVTETIGKIHGCFVEDTIEGLAARMAGFQRGFRLDAGQCDAALVPFNSRSVCQSLASLYLSE